MKADYSTRLKQALITAVVGIIVTFFCQTPEGRVACRGIDFILGHSPIVKVWRFAGPSLPVFGPVGFEASLVFANLIWARLGFFDGGFGVELEDGFTAEIFSSLARKEFVFAGLDFKFDFTYCTTCGISVFHEMADTLYDFAQGRRLLAQDGSGFPALKSYDLSAHPDFDLDGTPLPKVKDGRRLSEGSTPVDAPVSVETMLKAFLEQFKYLDLAQILFDAYSTAPDKDELPRLVEGFTEANAVVSDEP